MPRASAATHTALYTTLYRSLTTLSALYAVIDLYGLCGLLLGCSGSSRIVIFIDLLWFFLFLAFQGW